MDSTLLDVKTSLMMRHCLFQFESMKLLHMLQRDCYVRLIDIILFSAKANDYISGTSDVAGIDTYCHFSYAILHYLRGVKNVNPAFHDKPPKYIRRIPSAISVHPHLL